jgi:hypothetical protein
MHRAVLEDYKSLLTTLADGRMADAPARLEALEWERKAILERVEEISDYLNWHSATQTGDRSGAFERYLERSRAMAEPQPRRKDRISGYLDGMEDELRRR